MSSNTTLTKIVAVVAIAFGALFIGTGAGTYGMVSSTLAQENITVSEDAAFMAGAKVDGPLAAYAQADIINQHALHSTEGKTYAQMDREDPLRQVAMNASFLRASLFTSVVAFGVAVMAMGLGLLFILVGIALLNLARVTEARTAAPVDEVSAA